MAPKEKINTFIEFLSSAKGRGGMLHLLDLFFLPNNHRYNYFTDTDLTVFLQNDEVLAHIFQDMAFQRL